jgi:TDG/mug DNA glycosylase family protein
MEFLWQNGWRPAKPPQHQNAGSQSKPTGSLLPAIPPFVRSGNGHGEEISSLCEKQRKNTFMRSSRVALSHKRLTDHIRPELRILFVGINPGLRSAATGHHFSGHSNRFWRLLFESELIAEPLTHRDDWRIPDWGLGLTNIIQRPSSGIDVLKPRDYAAGKKRLLAIVEQYRPRTVSLLGVTIFRALFPECRTGRISLGQQTQTLAGQPLFVLPNPSGRNAHYSYRTMLDAFCSLRDLTSTSV